MQIKSPDRYSKSLTIRKSKTGLGVFAGKAFKAHVEICEINGKLITCGLDDDLDEKTRNNAIRFSEKYFLSPNGGIGDYFNHSCSPNSFITKKNGRLLLIALRDIKNEEEIRFDYSTITGGDDVWEMKCYCQNKDCRKIIKSFNKLPKKLRDKYLSLKMVPSYIYKYGR